MLLLRALVLNRLGQYRIEPNINPADFKTCRVSYDTPQSPFERATFCLSDGVTNADTVSSYVRLKKL